MPATVPVSDYVVSPFVVVVDSREQAPYEFKGLRSDQLDGGGPLAVRTAVRGLPAGDYSVEGYEAAVAVERKSLSDCYSTIGQSRQRFERELERLATYTFAAVVVEADWLQVLTDPPPHSRLSPKTVYRSVLRWQIRHRVHFLMMGSRELAERTTYRLLESFWREQQRVARPAARRGGLLPGAPASGQDGRPDAPPHAAPAPRKRARRPRSGGTN